MVRNCRFRSSALIFSCWTKLMISKAQHKLFSPLMGWRIAAMSNCSVDQRAPKKQSRSCKRLASLIAICESECGKIEPWGAGHSTSLSRCAARFSFETCSEEFKSAAAMTLALASVPLWPLTSDLWRALTKRLFKSTPPDLSLFLLITRTGSFVL